MPPTIQVTHDHFLPGYGFEEWNGSREYHYFLKDSVQKVIRFGKPGHYGWPHPGNRYDVGGEFGIEHYEIQNAVVPIGRVYQSTSDFWRAGYEGSMWSSHPYDWPNVLRDGLSWGASAYIKMKPTAPDFSGLNALYELREFPQMIGQLRERLRNFRELGKHYLGAQFGWKPFLGDLRKLLLDQQKIQKHLNQLLRDNGKPVRRKTLLSDMSTDPVVEDGEPWGYTYPMGYFYPGKPPRYRQTTVLTDRVWASARFRYWLPPGPQDIVYKRRLLAGLYGLDLTPSVIYNAIPWSWLVDWFSNVGDVIDNLDAGVADRLAADYFYVMREVKGVRSRTVNISYQRRTGEEVPATGTSFNTSRYFTRLKGDPFGFNTNEQMLSGMQLSILGALGLSRIR